MKKDKEWLKEELSKQINILHTTISSGNYVSSVKRAEIMNLIDQLEEPDEIELSEPSAWKTIAKLYHPNEVYWGNVRDSYIESLDEPEQVVVPQFVGDWIEHQKKGDLYSCLSSLTNYLKVHEWFYDNYEKNGFKSIFDLVAKIWLYGYTVEKEKLYKVLLPGVESLDRQMCMHEETKVISFADDGYNSRKYSKDDEFIRLFTEQEIKAIDERYWAFAEEITK